MTTVRKPTDRAPARDRQRIDVDVLVIGAGPLGIVTALELARANLRVALVESGQRRFKPEIQALSDSDSTGDDQWHARRSIVVRRQVGGASVLWGGRCVPFDPVDFDRRASDGRRLWPVAYADFARYLERACTWAVCGEPLFTTLAIPELATREMIAGFVEGSVKTTDLERWSLPTRFGAHYRREMRKHANLRLFTGLTCTRLACDPESGLVTQVELRRHSGDLTVGTARHYVLATGGLEATRLLMASDDVHRRGIGNHSGHLGRWYMAHVEAKIAQVHLSTPPHSTIYDHERDGDGVYVRRRFTVAPEAQKARGLSNAAVWLVNPPMADASHGSAVLSGVYLTLKSPFGRFLLADALREAGIAPLGDVSPRAHVRNIFRELPAATRFALDFSWRRFVRPGRKAPGFFVRSGENVYPLHYHGEHLPAWGSRVELSGERDRLGVRRLRTRLEFSGSDIANVRATLRCIDEQLQASGVGRVSYLDDNVEAAVRHYLVGRAGYHQTGTTRMSADPADGVVTSELAVHGVRNLSVAATSVLPTSSQANPTLTGIAFAIRLADHLAAQLAGVTRGKGDPSAGALRMP